MSGRQNQRVGKHGERQAEAYLDGLGFEMIGKIETPTVKTPYFDGRKIVPGVFRVAYAEKVAGDRRAVLNDGRSVLIEVKTIWDGNLLYSELKPHQHERLKKHASLGMALSLLVWVHHS